jgi:hypothetical protein
MGTESAKTNVGKVWRREYSLNPTSFTMIVTRQDVEIL